LQLAEVILVDNGSTDETDKLIGKLDGATILRNPENLHFICGANQAAQTARGEFILFLNNDAELLPNAIESSLKLMRSSNTIGAVGAKLIKRDGSLQEAGSIIWRDGITCGYGRGDDPLSPPYQFQRNVDYCSAAFLMTRKALFHKLGGFRLDF